MHFGYSAWNEWIMEMKERHWPLCGKTAGYGG